MVVPELSVHRIRWPLMTKQRPKKQLVSTARVVILTGQSKATLWIQNRLKNICPMNSAVTKQVVGNERWFPGQGIVPATSFPRMILVVFQKKIRKRDRKPELQRKIIAPINLKTFQIWEIPKKHDRNVQATASFVRKSSVTEWVNIPDLLHTYTWHNYCPHRKDGEGTIFTGVCLST